MRQTYLLFLGIIHFGFLMGACESKFSESSPNAVKISGLPLEERAQQKAKIDSRIDDVQTAADRTKKIIDMFRKVQNPSESADVYTPIDFLMDINNELKSQIPENGKNQKLVRRGKITLPFKNLSDECRIVETLLETDVQEKENPDIHTNTTERLVYQVKTCLSNGQYLPTIIASWTRETIEFRVENKNLETLFNNLLQQQEITTSTCRFKQNEDRIIHSFSCENMEIRLTASEAAYVRNMGFDNFGEIRFEAIADIFENKNKKARSSVRVMSNGEVKIQVNKIGPNGEILTNSDTQK